MRNQQCQGRYAIVTMLALFMLGAGCDAEFGFIRVDCSAYRQGIPRTCMGNAELTTYLALSILGMPEAELPDWRDRMLAARALSLSLLVK